MRDLSRLFESEEQWTQNASGRDANGSPTMFLKDGCSWCLAGRMELEFGPAGLNNYGAEAQAVVAAIRRIFPDRCGYDGCVAVEMIKFNDHPDTTFADIALLLAVVQRDLSLVTV